MDDQDIMDRKDYEWRSLGQSKNEETAVKNKVRMKRQLLKTGEGNGVSLDTSSGEKEGQKNRKTVRGQQRSKIYVRLDGEEIGFQRWKTAGQDHKRQEKMKKEPPP